MKRWISFFFLALLYFYFCNGWYEPSRLVISGLLPDGTSSFQVRWNSGEGFNSYEQREFHPSSYSLNNNEKYLLTIGSEGGVNPASLSKEVVCTAIVVDGKNLNLASLAKNISYINDALHFASNETLTIQTQANRHIGFRFETNNHSGIAYVAVNGREVEHDLYVANVEAKDRQFNYWLLQADGSFRVEMAMPRYKIQELEIYNSVAGHPFQLTTVELHGNGQVIPLHSGEDISLERISFTDGLNSFLSHYHPVQFCLQILFAFLTTWIIASLVKIYKKVGSVQACFFKKKRFVFWLLFGTSFTVFSLWLLALWPGIMSVDSLKVWRAAMLPDMYLNDHPMLNVVLYKYLFQLWGDPVIVPVVQVILMALLISWFFFWLYRKGVGLTVLLPCFLFILFSVPIGTYNTMLWKDIPFALLVVFWACTFVQLSWQRHHGCLSLSRQQLFVLLLLGLALGFIRHNGMVYIVILPILFVFLRLVPIKHVVVMSLVLCVAGVISYFTLQQVGEVPGTRFIEQELKKYASDVSVENVIQNSGRIAKEYSAVLYMSQTGQKWDKVHYYLKDRYAYWFLLHSGWWDVYP